MVQESAVFRVDMFTHSPVIVLIAMNRNSSLPLVVIQGLLVAYFPETLFEPFTLISNQLLYTLKQHILISKCFENHHERTVLRNRIKNELENRW